MTNGIIDPAFARLLHLRWLVPIGGLALAIHASWASRLALKRWHASNWLSQAAPAVIASVLVVSFAWLQFGSRPARAASHATTKPAQAVRELSQTELHANNGLAGKPAHFVVDGLVYDGSSLFGKGDHAGAAAGRDLSKECRSCHEPAEMGRYLKLYPVVGRLGAEGR